jgi:hypothetical protein
MNFKHSPIGGYSGLELNKFKEYHGEALSLNTGRNCLEYILRANEYKNIYIPFYICDAIFEPINKLNIKFDYYNIDESLDPVFSSTLNEEDAFLYVNYFGVKKKTVEKLASKFKNLIVDNTHDFFVNPLIGPDTFYSARKFFGVPDGAYLYVKNKLHITFEQDYSYNRMEHLLIQTDIGTVEGYKSFCKNEGLLSQQPIRIMSHLTKALLKNIDYENAKRLRKDNFLILHEKLGELNELKIDADESEAPFVYPFLCKNGEKLKEKATNNKIFLDTYWDTVLKKVSRNSMEIKLTKDLLPLPINPIYSKKEIELLGNFIRDKLFA